MVDNIDLYISIPYLIIYYAIVITCTALWWPKRKLSPLNARSNWFFFAFQGVCLLYGILHGLGVFGASSFFLSQIQLLVYPFFLQLYLWRFWSLFYIYHLTGARIKFYKQEDFTDWFITHRKWAKESFLLKTFVLVAVSEYTLFFILLGLTLLVDSILIYVFIVITAIYVICFLILIIKARKVRDAFYIKREFLALGIWIAFLIILFLIISFGGSDSVSSKAGDLFGLTTYLGCEIISIAFPIYKCYKKKYIPLADKEDSQAELLENPTVSEKFTQFLEERFLVENLFFSEQVQAFKQQANSSKARDIYNKFILAGSEMDLEIPSEVANRIYSKIDNGEVSQDLFSEVEALARSRLKEPLQDFSSTPEYLTLVKDKLEKDRLTEGFEQMGIKENN